MIIALVAVPLMAGTVMEKGAWESALHLVRLTAAIPVGAVWITGLAFIGAGLLFMSGWGTEVEEIRLTVTLAMAGLGFGLVILPSASAL